VLDNDAYCAYCRGIERGTHHGDQQQIQQIAYLRRLIADDYGTATTIGARITPDLTKQAASRFISMLRNGV